MSKKIVISFPGSRGSEIPLLYFCAKHYEDLGYEKVFVGHSDIDKCSYEEIIENADAVLTSLKLEEYEEIVFVAKSFGTVVACMLKEKYHLSAGLILLTPIEETLHYMRHDIKRNLQMIYHVVEHLENVI